MGSRVEGLPIRPERVSVPVLQNPMRKGPATGIHDTLSDSRPSVLVDRGASVKVGGYIYVIVIRGSLCELKVRRNDLITLSLPTGGRACD
jgi:hypothetical protein